MVAKAIARYIRISPRKVRLVADFIKGKSVGEALAILSNLNKRPCEFIEDVLRSAISNAKRNPEIKEEDLYISNLAVDGGPLLKRYRAGSMGRAMMIRHRMSHIRVELEARPKQKKEEPKDKRRKRAPLKAKKRGR